MTGEQYQSERREFVRIKVELQVRYKFICEGCSDPELAAVYQGCTGNISAGGMLLVGKVPRLDWLPNLLMKKMALGINLYLPTEESPLKALTRVAWLENMEEGSSLCSMGLKFQEITIQDKDRLFFFIVHHQLKEL